MSDFFQDACRIVSDAQAVQHRFLSEGYGRFSELRAPKVPTLAEAEEIARQRHERAQAFRNSPRGQFYMEIQRLQRLGYSEGGRLEGIYHRELADDRKPLNTKAVGACVAILSGLADIGEPALNALAQLLMS